jgi:hypothetical protein
MFKIFIPLLVFTATLATAMSSQWVTDIDNTRPYMEEHPALVAAAEWKAHVLNTQYNGVIQHCIDDECPNAMVSRFGCETGYDSSGNNVESLVAGTTDITVAYNNLKESPQHRPHIIGLGFHNDQVHYGVAQEGLIYVFLSAKCYD